MIVTISKNKCKYGLTLVNLAQAIVAMRLFSFCRILVFEYDFLSWDA